MQGLVHRQPGLLITNYKGLWRNACKQFHSFEIHLVFLKLQIPYIRGQRQYNYIFAIQLQCIAQINSYCALSHMLVGLFHLFYALYLAVSCYTMVGFNSIAHPSRIRSLSVVGDLISCHIDCLPSVYQSELLGVNRPQNSQIPMINYILQTKFHSSNFRQFPAPKHGYPRIMKHCVCR